MSLFQPPALALVEATREALLTAFLEDERGLAALAAEVAHAPGRARDLRPRRVGVVADMLAEHAGERIRQRQHLGGPEPRGLAAADPRELVRDLFQPALRGEGRR